MDSKTAWVVGEAETNIAECCKCAPADRYVHWHCIAVSGIADGDGARAVFCFLLQTQEMWSFIVPAGLVGLHVIRDGQYLDSLQLLLAGASKHVKPDNTY